MKKLSFYLLLFLKVGFSIELSETDSRCSEKSISQFSENLKNLSHYHKVDGDGFKYFTFNTLDMTQSDYAGKTKTGDSIYLIALRPLPKQVSSLSGNFYPQFYMKCNKAKLSSTEFDFHCSSLKDKHFTVEKIDIKLKFIAQSPKCPSNSTLININYILEINDKEYGELIDAIKKDLYKSNPDFMVDQIIDIMVKPKSFFSKYWKFFFQNWLK